MTYGGNPFDGPVGGDPFSGGPVGLRPPSAGAQPGAPGPAPAETNTLATLSVVFAFVFAPAGAILGHLGLSQIARTGQRGRDRAIIGTTLSYVVMVVAVVALVVWAAGANEAPPASTVAAPTSTTTSASRTTPKPPPPPPPPPTVDDAALPAILLNVDELTNLFDDHGLAQVWSSDGIGLQPERGGIDDPSCAGSYFKGTPAAYAGNEPRRFTGTDIGNHSTGQLFGQGVAVFDDGAAAQKALQGYLATWRSCVGKSAQTIPAMAGYTGMTLTYGAPVDAGGGITTLETTVAPTSPDGRYVHAIAVKDNVLVDNILISPDMGDKPQRLTQAMLDRIPG
jgi:eukaryotic-like serine/threonine-protein kinase